MMVSTFFPKFTGRPKHGSRTIPKPSSGQNSSNASVRINPINYKQTTDPKLNEVIKLINNRSDEGYALSQSLKDAMRDLDPDSQLGKSVRHRIERLVQLIKLPKKLSQSLDNANKDMFSFELSSSSAFKLPQEIRLKIRSCLVSLHLEELG